MCYGVVVATKNDGTSEPATSGSSVTQGYDPSQFPPFAVTADLVILTVRPPQVQVLLVERERDPYAGGVGAAWRFRGVQNKAWSKPPSSSCKTRPGYQSMQRILSNWPRLATQIEILVCGVISVAWLALVAHPDEPVAGAESVDAAWVDVASLDRTLLAFDHAAILSAGIERARNRIEYTTLAPTFCGDTFSMGELRSVYETLWGHPLDPANFNRKVLATPGFVEPTGDVVAQPKGRPAKTYQRGQAKRLKPPLQR